MLVTTAKRTICPRCSLHQQIRHASLIRRPKRPYTFTQLITLSDGSTFTHRTTSPQPIYRSTKDTKNTILWNPSSQRLLNVEEDEAGRLRRFRSRFGRGFDAESLEVEGEKDAQTEDSVAAEQEDENLLDMISSFSPEPKTKPKNKPSGGKSTQPADAKGKDGKK